eukprot:jgi/Pico_ML_1/54410/g4763.t1
MYEDAHAKREPSKEDARRHRQVVPEVDVEGDAANKKNRIQVAAIVGTVWALLVKVKDTENQLR